jgi:GWxTD domain-containing protein
MLPRSHAVTARRALGPTAVFPIVLLLVLLLIAARAAEASFVRPLESKGEIAAVLDVHDTPNEAGGMDLVLMLAIPNRELAFQEGVGGRFTGRILVDAEIVQPDGATLSRREEMKLTALHADDVSSGVARQVLSLDLGEVTSPYASLTCRVSDINASRVVNRDEPPRPPEARFRGEWVAPETVDEVAGLYLHEPLFVAGAPLGMLPPGLEDLPPLQRQLVSEHLHPARRYGLEQDRLQVVFDVEAATRGPNAPKLMPTSLLIQVLAKELDLAYRDTIEVMDDPHAFIASGGHATVSWELDVDDLPPGSYQLSCAPLDGLANAWVNEFDVIWSMEALRRPRDELLLVGYLVLPDDELDRFEVAGAVEQDAILARFWQEHDPDPSTRINEAEIEFRERMSFVRRSLGGFGRKGPIDDRGDIYLMLGPPDEVEKQVVPINADSFEDAMAKVFNEFTPIRVGLIAEPNGENERNFQRTDTTIQAEREMRSMITSPERMKAFELWTYKGNGRSLFPHEYDSFAIGLRFLFLARLSEGTYRLETTNATDYGG